jgi:hypothetical protein
MEAEFLELARQCRPFTMTSLERQYGLWQTVRYVVQHGIPGDLVECGVWRGGSAMLMALTLAELGSRDRQIWLYDTFAGMTEPTDRDVSDREHRTGRELWLDSRRSDLSDFCYASLEDVRRNMATIPYPLGQMRFVQGPVEQTLPADAPEKIALLRLDTDWYESTHHELTHLFPRLVSGGVLIIDDYGYWRGARDAVDNYFRDLGVPLLLHRLDSSGRIGVKST